MIGGAIVAGDPVDVLGAEGDERREVLLPHGMAKPGEPSGIFLARKWKRGNERTGPFLDVQFHAALPAKSAAPHSDPVASSSRNTAFR